MPSPEKLDLYKLHRNQYAAPKAPIVLTVDEEDSRQISQNKEQSSTIRHHVGVYHHTNRV